MNSNKVRYLLILNLVLIVQHSVKSLAIKTCQEPIAGLKFYIKTPNDATAISLLEANRIEQKSNV